MTSGRFPHTEKLTTEQLWKLIQTRGESDHRVPYRWVRDYVQRADRLPAWAPVEREQMKERAS